MDDGRTSGVGGDHLQIWIWGCGSLSLPLLLFVLPPKIALGLLLPLFLITDVWVVYILRRMLDRRILMIMCGFGLLGQLLGWILFDFLSDRLLTSLIGLIAMITELNYGWRRIRPGKRTSAQELRHQILTSAQVINFGTLVFHGAEVNISIKLGAEVNI